MRLEQDPVAEDSVEVVEPEETHANSPIVLTRADPSWGDAEALVTIVGFLDFECPFCQRVQATLGQIRQTYTSAEVRFVWKNNPLPFHKEARPAHEAAVAVHRLAGNEAFFRFHDLAFEHQADLSADNFAKWAEQAKVEWPVVERELDDPEVAAKVEGDMAQAKRLGISGTPAFRINGIVLSGAQPLDRFASVIDEQLEAAAHELDSGTPRALVSLNLTLRNFEEPKPAAPPGEVAEPAPDTTVHKIEVDADDPVRGPNDALVTIVEWAEFQCPFCQRVQATLKEIREKYRNDVRIVWKDNPLPFHAQAKPAAEFARYVAKRRGNDAFWDVHDALFERQQELGDPLYEELSKARGLPWADAKASIERGAFSRQIELEQRTAGDFEARGTPHFFINGRRLSGAQPFSKFEALIEEQLELARRLVASGVPRARVYDKILATAQPAPEPEKRAAPAVSAANPSRGPARARVVIQEFGDFQCPFCKRVQPTLEALRQKYPKQIRVVFRHLPLPFHREAKLAAAASMEAFAQRGNAGFFAYHDLLYENQKELTRTDLERYAEQMGLHMARFRRALDEGTHQASVEADIKVASEVGISGTPGFLINDYFLSGAQPVSTFERLIELALEAKPPLH